MNPTRGLAAPFTKAAGSGWSLVSRPPVTWAVLLVWELLWVAVQYSHHSWSWHFVAAGVRAMFSPDALSLYAAHPELQMGPLTFLIAAPFVLVLRGQVGATCAFILAAGLGVLVVREIRLLARASGRLSDRRWFFAALLILPVWTEVAVHWEHVDDAAALFFGVLGLRLVRTGHPLGAAAAFALAVDFKPWAVPLAAVLAMAPRRQWLPVAGIWVAIVAIAWAPFLLADAGTAGVTSFAIPIDRASTLHLLGVPGRGTPSWDRYAQVGLALVLAVLAVVRRRWAAVFLIVVAVRLLLDPGTKNYYDAGLVIGAGIFDVVLASGLVPLMTIVATVFVYLPSYLLAGAPMERGVTRTVALLALLAGAFVLGQPRPSRPQEGSARPTRAVAKPGALG